MASHTLKMAVVAPMPSAMVTTAVRANPGDLRERAQAEADVVGEVHVLE